MSKPVIVLRPEPGQTETLVAAFQSGLEASGMPLCSISPVDWKAPAKPYDGVLVGSANALRHAGKELEKITHLPVIAVGEATARLAQDAGMELELVGKGGLQTVLGTLPSIQRNLLRLAGEVHLPLDALGKVSIDTVITYRTDYRRLSSKQVAFLAQGAVVLLHSGEMAAHFARECDANKLDRHSFDCIAMAPRIAERAGEGWGSLTIAEGASDASLLAATQALCEKQV